MSSLRMISEAKENGIWKPILVMVAVQIVFAGLDLLVKDVLDKGMSPFILVTYRQSIGAIFIGPIAYPIERKKRSRNKITLSIFRLLFVSGIIGSAFNQILFFVGLQHTSATYACAFIDLVPVVTFLLSLLFRLESINLKSKVDIAKAMGTHVCVAGATLFMLYRGRIFTLWHGNMGLQYHNYQLSMVQSENRTLGSMALVGGCICWLARYIIEAKIDTRYPLKYTTNAFMSLFGAILSAILTLSVDRKPSYWALKGHMELITIIYSGVVASGLGFIWMAWCVEQRGPVVSAAFTPLIQLIVAAVDLLGLRKKLYLGSLLGSILIGGGLYCLLWGINKEKQGCCCSFSTNNVRAAAATTTTTTTTTNEENASNAI